MSNNKSLITRFAQFLSIRNFRNVKYFDVWPYTPVYELPGFRSNLGWCLGVVAVAVTIINVVLSTKDFVNEVPTVVYSAQVPMNYSSTRIPKVGVLFRPEINNVPFDYYNESYWSVDYSVRTIREQDKLPRVKVPIGKEMCSFPGNPNEDYPDPPPVTVLGVCPVGDLSVAGTFETKAYVYLDIAINKCLCLNSSAPCNCAPSAEIDKLWFTTSVDFIVRQVDYEYESTIVQYWRPTTAYYFGVDLFFTKRNINVKPRYFFDVYKTEYLLFSQYIQRINTPTTGQLMKFYVRLDATMHNEYRSAPTILELFGRWGSVWSFLALFLGTIVIKWNEHSFHKLFPRDKIKEARREDFSKFGKFIGKFSAVVEQAEGNREIPEEGNKLEVTEQKGETPLVDNTPSETVDT
jgi:hypothetical protein